MDAFLRFKLPRDEDQLQQALGGERAHEVIHEFIIYLTKRASNEQLNEDEAEMLKAVSYKFISLISKYNITGFEIEEDNAD